MFLFQGGTIQFLSRAGFL